MPLNHTLFWPMMALAVLLGSHVRSQDVPAPLTCSAHFQARANWLTTFDGHPATATFMSIRAETLWFSVPRDCGMPTGFGNGRCKYNPGRHSVSDVIIEWIEAGQNHPTLPTCMEDSFCAGCLSEYDAVMR